MADYRNTKYCPEYENISDKKQNLKAEIEKKHQVKDLYKLVSPNEGAFKLNFMKVYNNKCSYCGVQMPIIPKQLFEIDHFKNKKHSSFETEADAGTMENLVLSCRKCNRAKSAFMIENEDYAKLYPDDGSIAGSFSRDDMFYIIVAPEKKNDSRIQSFYEQLKLNEEVHRLDYLLMNMRGLKNKVVDKPEICQLLSEAINVLQGKRAIGVYER